ncbi:phosphogluconate dehydrogenase C-terminal domain-containing protein [Pelagicoccus albus]|uniref:Semialdehyde dehydrogenase n=1 Tax=Pelagicoccus albus TaxID=415222 RepID=A0A7X1B7E1_9BACT|nr:phosphogluconate dehydrogenase C-terminal domain-containing protein [Pelagicoccus albus]MBC2607060.1 semialdehyde dehydrogenase [Pelagicoccus albus]
MKKTITLVGAGGKMGNRLTNNLMNSEYAVRYLEVSLAGIEQLEGKGLSVSKAEDCIPNSDIVIFAVPDVAIAKVAQQYVPMMKSGSMGMCLDPAAPLAGALPERDDVAYFASHPSHPSIFNWESTEEGQRDYFGGILAKQTIVCSLIQGTDEDYHVGEALARVIYGPVSKAYRIELEHMGILEPALSETFAACLVVAMKEAIDSVVEKGVDREAATEFLLGHLNIELAVVFGQLPGGQFSDAALKAIELGKKSILRDDWKSVFEPDSVAEQIRQIT